MGEETWDWRRRKGNDRARSVVRASGLFCLECGREWTDGRERWRALVMHDDDTDDELCLFCSFCAEWEFGPAR